MEKHRDEITKNLLRKFHQFTKGFVCFVLVAVLLIHSMRPAYAAKIGSNFLVDSSTKSTHLAFIQFLPELVPLLEAIGVGVGEMAGFEVGEVIGSVGSDAAIAMQPITSEIIGGITTYALEGTVLEINPVGISAINNFLRTSVALGKKVIVKHGDKIMLSFEIGMLTPGGIEGIKLIKKMFEKVENSPINLCKAHTLILDGEEIILDDIKDYCPS
ncbi:hypothetical protein H6G27_33725 [Nostoc linckia FACHB-104]|nr:hypothetical protein [Nostoc linckia FACHB-104]